MRLSDDLIRGVAVGLALLLLTAPIAARIGGRTGDFRLARMATRSLVIKLLAAPLYLLVFERVYGSTADYNLYHHLGVELAQNIHRGYFAANVGPVIGTGWPSIVTGVFYSAVGVTELGAFFFFSWLAFLGMLLFFRAFQIAFPDDDHLRYARFIFFFPSVLFWTAVIGKDAWMCMGLGLAAYGGARVLQRQLLSGALALAAGLGLSALVRPHVALIFMVAITGGYVLRPTPALRHRPNVAAKFGKLLVVALLAAASVALAGQVRHFLGLHSLSAQSVNAQLNLTSRLSQGHLYGPQDPTTGFGSSFNPQGMRSPIGFPWAIVTVLFRPFPFEARNLQMALASLESTSLLIIAFASRRRITSALRALRRAPYVALATIYAAIFIYAFTSLANFGLLARERVQLLPFFFVLLAHPVVARRRAGSRRRSAPSAPAPESAIQPRPRSAWSSRGVA